MKPTWQGWSEVRAAQQTDVSSTEECLYAGRWTEHNDVNWLEWQRSYDIIGLPKSPLPWNHCSSEEVMPLDITMHLWLNAAISKLWNPVQPEEYDTLWRPVIYPN